jgi:hypothetical protein
LKIRAERPETAGDKRESSVVVLIAFSSPVSEMSLTERHALEILQNMTQHIYAAALEDDAATIERDVRHLLARVGQAEKVYRTEEELLSEILVLIIAALRSGELSPWLRNLLANFITSELHNNDDDVLARRFLNLPARGRGHPKTDTVVRWDRASAVYCHWIETGHTDEEALRATWESYFFGAKDLDKEKRTGARRTDVLRSETKYEAQLRMIKTWLHRDGYRTPERQGRKPAKKRIAKANSRISTSH